MVKESPITTSSERSGASLASQAVRTGSAVTTGFHPKVAEHLKAFETTLGKAVEALDRIIPADGPPENTDQVNAVIVLCAWVHSEWIRIHPFANGNGRTAHIWAGYIAMRYGVPPFVTLRPRPDGGYGDAGKKAMEGDWRPTAAVFSRMYLDTVGGN